MKTLSIILLLIITTGCATTYQPKSYSGGYSQMQLNTDVWRVSFHGNGYTSRQRVRDFAMLRAAEIALARQHRWFVVLSDQNSQKNYSYTTPTTYNTTYTDYSSYTTQTGGQTYHGSKPANEIIIQTFHLHNKPNVYHYDALLIRNQVKAAYKIE